MESAKSVESSITALTFPENSTMDDFSSAVILSDTTLMGPWLFSFDVSARPKLDVKKSAKHARVSKNRYFCIDLQNIEIFTEPSFNMPF